MTTLAADKPRAYALGDVVDLPVIASDIIYEGSAVGENGAGHVRPLVAADPFKGFCLRKADNSAGSAADINARIQRKGSIELAVTSAAITDIGKPVYASDDNVFNVSGIGSFIGYIRRFVSTGVAIVDFTDEQEETYVLSLPITLAAVADGDVVTTFTPGHHGRIKSLDFLVDVAVTTAAKLTTLNAEIGTTNVTGGTVALTSANCTPQGAIVADAAITALAAFDNDSTISIEASSTTTFVEGSGTLLVTIGK